MSIHRSRFLGYLVAGLMLLGASTAAAQVRIPTENTIEDLQLFAPVESNAMSDRPYLKEGLFLNYDYLTWSVQRPRVAIIGAPGETRRVFQPTNFLFFNETNAIDTSIYEDLIVDGHRTEVGFIRDNCGWIAGWTGLHDKSQQAVYSHAPVIFRDPQGITQTTFIQRPGTNIDLDLDGDRVYGQDGEDLGTFQNPFVASAAGGVLVPGNVVVVAQAPNPPVNEPAFVGAPGTVGRPAHPAGSLGNGIGPGFYLPFDRIPESFPNGDVPDLGDAVPALLDFDDLVATNYTEFYTGELMNLRRLDRVMFKGHTELMYGVRYVNFEEQWHVDAFGGVLANSSWNNQAYNRIIGPQLGARWFHDCCRWRFAVEGRFAPAVNFQAIRLRSDIGSNRSALFFQNTGNESMHEYDFSPVGELRLNWSYQLTRAIAVRAGYTALYVGNLARPSNMVIYELPNLHLIRNNYLDDCFMQGVNLGIEINR